jgi:hypothetical protein
MILLPGLPAGPAGAVPTRPVEPAAWAATAPSAPVDEPGQDEVSDADGGLRVVLDELDPTVPHVGEPLTLRGRIVNDSTQRRRLSLVTVRSAWLPLASRAEIASWLEGVDQRETGWVLGQDAVGPVVVPGAAVPFRVEVPEWGLNAVPGDLAVLAVEIEATGEPEPGTAALPLEPVVLRTVLAAARAHEVTEPLDVSWVVPLTLPADPALTSQDDDERHQAWVSATGAGSAARTWLEHLTLPAVTWMVDPSLLVPVDPADAFAEASPGTGEPGPDEPGGEPDDDAETDEPAQDPQATDGATTTSAPDPAAATEAPGQDAADDAPSTAGPGDSPAGGLEEGQELGGAPEPEAAAPASVADVEEAIAQLSGLLAGAPSQQLWWTPAADPDVAALLGQRRTVTTVRTAMNLQLPAAPASAEGLLRQGRSDIAWPALTSATADQVAALDRFWGSRPATPEGTAAVVLPIESLAAVSDAPVGAAARRVQDNEGVVVLGADSRSTALLAGAEADALRVGEAAVTQQLLADSLAAYQQDPPTPRSLVYAPPRDARVPGRVLDTLSEGLRTAPWTRDTPAAALLAAARDLEPAALSGAAPDADVLGRTLADRLEPPASPLDARAVRQLTRLHTSLAGLTEIIDDDAAAASWEPLLSHLWSTRWRSQPEAWTEAWRDTRRPILRVQEAVHVNPSTVNFLSDQGIVQVTLVNDLPVPVEGVRVELVPDNSLLRVVQQPEEISIGAESRATVSFTAQAVTRGVTTVRARLTTPNGTVLGDDAEVSVRVQPTGVWIYWVLGSIAGLVLVLGLLRARRTAPRSAAVAAAPAPPASPSTTPEENR